MPLRPDYLFSMEVINKIDRRLPHVISGKLPLHCTCMHDPSPVMPGAASDESK
jgi:hypothetical protein